MKQWLKTAANVSPLLPQEVKLTGLLDDGGQGVVYRGTCHGVDAAVKFYLPGQVETRITREVDALEHLVCPSIVRLLWHGEISAGDHRVHVVATELVKGESLAQMITRGGLRYEQLGVLGFDVAEAIAAMWARRIVHRDLKPGNILIRQNGRVCVIDLGLARHLDEASLTAAGYTWGTRGYMSPEQWRGARSLSCHCDVFALGVVILEAAAGRHPTDRDQDRLVKERIAVQIDRAAADWTHADLVKRMLDPRPNCRPTPRQILNALSAHAPKEGGVEACPSM